MEFINVVSDSTQELFDAQAHVWNHIYSFVNSTSLKSAIQLGIADAIHKYGKPMTLSELADALPINKAKTYGLYRLMRILVHSKFFEKVKISDAEEAYGLTRASRLLVKDEPLSLAPFGLAMLHPVMTEPFHHVSEWLQNEDPTPFFTSHGSVVWDYTVTDPKWIKDYYVSVRSDARLLAGVFAKECRQVFEGVRTMVDVGGGDGAMSKAVAHAFPGMKCIVLDLPHVVDQAEESENVRFVSGDMFVTIPQADAVFLKWSIIQWTHDEGVKLLEKCKEAIDPDRNKVAKVIIVEMVVGDRKKDHEATETQLFFDMHNLTAFTGAGDRTEEEWAKLFFAAGFSRYKITPVLGLRSVIEVFP